MSIRHWQGEFHLADPNFLNRLRARKRVLMSGWMLRDWGLFEKHQDAARVFFAPPLRHQKIAEEFIRTCRARCEPLIGVVMRQGDYRVWRDGEFYITSPQYRTMVEQLRDRFGPRCGFVIACDEKQDANLFDGLNAHWCTGKHAGPGHYLESFAELALCDYVVSVPSTFSALAAFLGRVPLIPIAGAGADLRTGPILPNHLFDARLDPIFKLAVA
jgi:hypothetical protein